MLLALPGINGVCLAMAGVCLTGSGRVHVSRFRSCAHQWFWGVMLHGGYGSPRAGAFGSCRWCCCCSLLFIGTVKTHGITHSLIQTHQSNAIIQLFGFSLFESVLPLAQSKYVNACWPGVKALLSTGIAEALLVTARLAGVRAWALRLLLYLHWRAVECHCCNTDKQVH